MQEKDNTIRFDAEGLTAEEQSVMNGASFDIDAVTKRLEEKGVAVVSDNEEFSIKGTKFYVHLHTKKGLMLGLCKDQDVTIKDSGIEKVNI